MTLALLLKKPIADLSKYANLLREKFNVDSKKIDGMPI